MHTVSLIEHPAVRRFFERHRNHGTSRPSVAIFDCDGTVISGDIGEAMFYHQIEQFWFRVSPAEVWPDHPSRSELDRLYRMLAGLPPAERPHHPSFHHFADALLDWYFGQIDDGRVVKACTDIVRLFTGFPESEVRELARRTFDDEVGAPRTRRRLGRRDIPGGIRFLVEPVGLLREARARGLDVWANSGSSRWSVEPVFAALGVPPDRVIGIEMETSAGIVTPKEILPIPIREGKIEAMKAKGVPMPVLVASDSRNDIPLFRASTDLRIRVNSRGRDTEEFFRAYGTPPDDSWINLDQPTPAPGH